MNHPVDNKPNNSPPQMLMAHDPLLVVVVERDANGKTVTQIVGSQELDVPIFGLMLVDILRHGAAALKVPEDAVWQWVDVERNHPTTDLHEVVPQ